MIETITAQREQLALLMDRLAEVTGNPVKPPPCEPCFYRRRIENGVQLGQCAADDPGGPLCAALTCGPDQAPERDVCRAAMLGMAGIGEDEAKRACACSSCKPARTVTP